MNKTTCSKQRKNLDKQPITVLESILQHENANG